MLFSYTLTDKIKKKKNILWICFYYVSEMFYWCNIPRNRTRIFIDFFQYVTNNNLDKTPLFPIFLAWLFVIFKSKDLDFQYCFKFRTILNWFSDLVCSITTQTKQFTLNCYESFRNVDSFKCKAVLFLNKKYWKAFVT